MLRPKLDFLSKCFAELPNLEQFQAESVPLLSRFAVAGKKRNDLVHGAITSLSAQDSTFTFWKIDVTPKESHSIRSVFLDQTDWTTFRKELLSLGKDGQALVQRVWDALKNKQQAASEQKEVPTAPRHIFDSQPSCLRTIVPRETFGALSFHLAF